MAIYEVRGWIGGRHWLTPGTAVEQVARLARRAFDAVMLSRQKRVNDDIARYLERSGGRLTDQIERDIMQQLMRNWNLRP
jgi:uncharacterized protein YozE (UPF0346 family)